MTRSARTGTSPTVISRTRHVGEGLVAEVGRGQRRQHVARPRPPDPEAGPLRGDVARSGRSPSSGRWRAHPLAVVVAEGGAGDDREALLAEPRDGEVALDPAAAVEHLRVGDLADARGRRGCRRGLRGSSAAPGPSISSLANEDSSKIATRLAGGAVLGADRRRPVLPGPAARPQRLVARGGVRLVPVDPLPARFLAEGGVVLAVPGVDRRRPAAAARPGARGWGSGCRSRSRRSPGSARGCRRASGTGRRSGGCPCARGRGSARPRRSTRPSLCRSRRRRRARGRRSRRRRRSRATSVSPRQNSLSGVKASGPLISLVTVISSIAGTRRFGVLGDLLEAVPVLFEQAAVEVGRDPVEAARARRAGRPARCWRS